MRIGEDAIIFTKSLKRQTISVGMLSQRYNRGQDQLVPIAVYRADTLKPDPEFLADFEASAREICRIASFGREELGARIRHLFSQDASGTAIYIQGVRKNELEFDAERGDVVHAKRDEYKRRRPGLLPSKVVYCILFFLFILIRCRSLLTSHCGVIAR